MTNPLRYMYKKLRGASKKSASSARPPAYPAQWRHAMALQPYRPDFYVVANIIGYAGSITDSPTVFFLAGSTYGHIVQSDSDLNNVGREIVDDFSHVAGTGYRITNESIDGRTVAVERFIYWNNQLSPPIYTYHGKFFDCRTMPASLRVQAMALLARSIRYFPMKKQRWEQH